MGLDGSGFIKSILPPGLWTTQSADAAQSVIVCVNENYVPEAKEQMLDNASQAMAKKIKNKN